MYKKFKKYLPYDFSIAHYKIIFSFVYIHIMSNNTQPTENQSLNQNIANTCNLVSVMMNTDNVNQQTRNAVTEMINLILNSDTYITLVREQIKTIISDGTFDQNDLPAVLTIVLQSKTFLRTVLSQTALITTNLNMNTLKYVIYAIIYFVMTLENANPAVITSFNTTFSPLWNLVSIDPQEFVSDVSVITHKCFPCFYKK